MTDNLVERLRDPNYAGPFQHLRPYDEIDALFVEAASELSRLQQALVAAESEHRKQTSDMAERFRAVNISRVIEQTGQNIFDLRDRAEAAEAKLASLPALLAETRKKALEEAAQVGDMMGIDSRTEAVSRAADGDYHAANHFNAHALGCEQVSAALLALQENSNG